MKAVINGKRYNTETAERICDCSPRGFYGGDFRWEDTALYLTKKGSWFLAGAGGPMSRWARPTGQTGRTDGKGISPISASEARSMLERYGTPEMVEQHFEIEDA